MVRADFQHRSGVDPSVLGSLPRSDAPADLMAWGKHVARMHRGAFAFCVASADGGWSVLARDIIGARPLYMAHSNGRVLCAESIQRLLSTLEDRPSLDPTRIADALMPIQEFSDAERTCFLGVEAVPPGHVVVVSGGVVHKERYWSPPRHVLPADATDRDYEEGLYDTLRDAVAHASDVEHDVGVLMSGGIDSVSVASLLASLRPPARTVSLVGDEDGPCPERFFVREAAQMLALDDVQLTPREAAAHDEGVLEFLATADDPFVLGVFPLPIMGLLRAAGSGRSRMLTGLCGDLLSGSPWRAEREVLLREGPVAGARTIVALHGEGARSLALRARLARRAVGLALPSVVRRARYQRLQRSHWKQLRTSSYIRSEFASETDLEDRWRVTHARIWGPQPGSDRDGQFARLCEPTLGRALERYARAAAFAGVAIDHPLVDRMALEFSLAAPPRQRLLGGLPKGLLRRAMAGHVPESVRARVDRLNPADHHTYAFTERNWGALVDGLETHREAMDPFVDTERVTAALERCEAELHAGTAHELWSLFVLGAFLHRFG